ncbi:unnamed protein product, partial [Linum tenue]
MVFLMVERSIRSRDVDYASQRVVQCTSATFIENDLDLFFIHFSSLLAEKRRKETESDYNGKQSVPYIMMEDSPFLQHAAKVFTPNIFNRIQNQYLKTEPYLKVFTPCAR